MSFNVPIAVGYGNGIAVSGGYLFATIVLTIFTLGFVAMARYGFYPWSVAAYIELAAAAPWRWFSAMDLCVEPEIARDDAAVLDRIAPVGAFKFAAASADPNKPARTGEELYKSVCMACHDTGTAGAPKKGDTAAWAPRIAQGYDTLLKNALNGKNAMPAKGGATDASDYEIGRAIVYLTGASGGKFKEPAAPAK